MQMALPLPPPPFKASSAQWQLCQLALSSGSQEAQSGTGRSQKHKVKWLVLHNPALSSPSLLPLPIIVLFAICLSHLKLMEIYWCCVNSYKSFQFVLTVESFSYRFRNY